MSTYVFGSLAAGQHIAFDPTNDVLQFTGASDSATAVQVGVSGANVSLTFGGKTVWFDATALGEIAYTNITFANGSYLVFGDATNGNQFDYYGQSYSFQSSTVGYQVWGLGGADLIQTGSGADWIVGNAALSPLNHVTRIGSTGSPNNSSYASISADGRFVAFEGGWTAFGSNNNSATDVLVKDMTSGTVSNEHITYDGQYGRSGSGVPVISADGNWLTFLSASPSMVAGDDSGALYDIYRSDTHGNGIVRVSTGTGGTLAADGGADNPDISADGRYVVFESSTSNWAAGGSTAQRDIFVKDVQTGELVRVSTSLTSGDGNGDSSHAKISADGRFVVFQSDASNLTANDTNGHADIFFWDRNNDSLTNLSDLMGAGTRNPDNSDSGADIAYDATDTTSYGNVIVFETAKGLVAEDTSNNTDIYAYYLDTGKFQLVSSKADGSGVQLSSEGPSVSGDGRYVVFSSGSEELVAGDSNGYRDVFVKDLVTGQIALVSKTAAGVAANGTSTDAQISLGGDWIVFESSATNLASTDGNGGGEDVFRVSNPLLKDTLTGGSGNDTYVLSRADIIVEAANGGTDTVRSSISYALGSNLENLVLTGTGNLTGRGNTLNNVITGNSGNNLIDGGAGTDTASYAASAVGVQVSLATTTAQVTGAGTDTLLAIENLIGSSSNDVLTGNSGGNRLDGGLGNDTLTGGTGNDTYVVNSSGDVIVESGTSTTEIDTVISSVTWTLGARLENLTLTGTTAINGGGNTAANVITGNAGNNTLYGYAGNDTINGGTGNDTLSGSTGNDTYIVDSTADVIVESGTATTEIDTVQSSVSWTLGARLENLTLTGTGTISGGGNTSANMLIGNSAANLLNGYSGNDTLNGGAGNDILIGGAGSDTLTGGSGVDAFVFNSNVGSDTLTDFASGTDKLRISQSALKVGDGDLLVEGAATRSAPGGFSSSAELVVFTANQASLSATSAAAAIGSATSAYAAGHTALFAIDNGSSSALYLFTSAGPDALVSASELTLLGTLNGTAGTATTDYVFVA